MMRAVGLLAMLLVWAVCPGQPASAQTALGIYNGSGTLTLDDLQFSIDPGAVCQIKNGSSSHACTASDRLFLAPTTGPGASVVIEALDTSNNPVPIFTFTCTTSGGCSTSHGVPTFDLSFSLDVQAVGAHTTITSLYQSITGSVSPNTTALQNDVHVGETALTSTGTVLATLNSTLANTSPSTATFAAQTFLVIKKDLGLSINNIANGSTLALNTVVQSFTPAPEPSSIALLLAGLLGMRTARRRRSRR